MKAIEEIEEIEKIKKAENTEDIKDIKNKENIENIEEKGTADWKQEEAGAAEQTLEESFAVLDKLVEKLEDPSVSLEESFRVYQKGIELLKNCNRKIDTVEKKMLQMNRDGELSEF